MCGGTESTNSFFSARGSRRRLQRHSTEGKARHSFLVHFFLPQEERVMNSEPSAPFQKQLFNKTFSTQKSFSCAMPVSSFRFGTRWGGGSKSKTVSAQKTLLEKEREAGCCLLWRSEEEA